MMWFFLGIGMAKVPMMGHGLSLSVSFIMTIECSWHQIIKFHLHNNISGFIKRPPKKIHLETPCVIRQMFVINFFF